METEANINILEEWKKEFFVHSSPLSFDGGWCSRSDIEGVSHCLLNYFGENFFLEKNKAKIQSISKIHLIKWLIGQKSKDTLTQIFQYASLLEYSQTLNVEIQKSLKSYIKSPEQFENSMFEIFTYLLLDYNNIENRKGTVKGNQILEGDCKINGKLFLFECRKSYSVAKEKFAFTLEVMNYLLQHINKKTVGNEFLGYLTIKEFSGTTKNEIRDILKEYFGQLGKPNYSLRGLHECKHLKFETKLYSKENQIEYNLRKNNDEIKFRQFISQEFLDMGLNNYKVEVDPQISVTQEKITEKLIKTINKKRKQHNPSRDQNRIIFIDSEFDRSFNFPILIDEKMIDENRINEFLNKKSTNDIVVIILRNYLKIVPSFKIKVFCKEKFSTEKRIIENLKTNFGYKVRLNA